MATRSICPRCGGTIIRDDRGNQLGRLKGVTYSLGGNSCNCSPNINKESKE